VLRVRNAIDSLLVVRVGLDNLISLEPAYPHQYLQIGECW
jgi:hypothetical protein